MGRAYGCVHCGRILLKRAEFNNRNGGKGEMENALKEVSRVNFAPIINKGIPG